MQRGAGLKFTRADPLDAAASALALAHELRVKLVQMLKVLQPERSRLDGARVALQLGQQRVHSQLAHEVGAVCRACARQGRKLDPC
eukprot:6174737-Pleurochrysis_carterae.AAC.1